ncbi:hypothetical protein [Pseudophaeobacter sp. EL27]|uniref:hypothetical protein n=1 Tax=Pseudophaeobacter sp. EL27 TaxID=2107580 RepID=UPI0013C5030E|nr:hypothetical protein [Pseudophaeobacter sp. EL27]
MRIMAITTLALGFTLSLGIPAIAANVAGTDGQDSIGNLPCSAQEGQLLSDCHFETLRKEDGSFTVRVLLPGGGIRYLYGADGKVTGTDSTGLLASKRLKNKTIVHIRPGEMFEIANELIDGQ